MIRRSSRRGAPIVTELTRFSRVTSSVSRWTNAGSEPARGCRAGRRGCRPRGRRSPHDPVVSLSRTDWTPYWWTTLSISTRRRSLAGTSGSSALVAALVGAAWSSRRRRGRSLFSRTLTSQSSKSSGSRLSSSAAAVPGGLGRMLALEVLVDRPGEQRHQADQGDDQDRQPEQHLDQRVALGPRRAGPCSRRLDLSSRAIPISCRPLPALSIPRRPCPT